MRDRFWKLYEQTLYAERYYWHYRQRAIFWNNVVQVFLLAAALSGVAGLWIWSKMPNIWAVVAMVAQLVSAGAYLLPQSNQIRALDYLLPELQALLERIEHDWNAIDLPDAISDAELNDLILAYRTEFNDMESKYTGGISFPVCEYANEKAKIDCETHKFSHFDIDEFDSFKKEGLHDAEKQSKFN